MTPSNMSTNAHRVVGVPASPRCALAEHAERPGGLFRLHRLAGVLPVAHGERRAGSNLDFLQTGSARLTNGSPG
jgi:hypothetical protein